MRLLRVAGIAFIALVCLAAFLAAWAFWWEPSGLTVEHYNLQIRGWKPERDNYKIVVISDLHCGSAYIDRDKLRRVVDLANRENPDLIVLPGDFISENDKTADRISMPLAEITENLRGFQAKHGTFAVIGNHDWWYDEPAVRAALEKAGIRVLDNEITLLDENNGKLWLLGIEDYWKPRKPNLEKPLSQIAPGDTALAVTHNPDAFVPLQDKPVILTLAGHMHGGQVRFPIYGAPILPSEYGERFLHGHVVENDKHLFVTRGVGTSGFGARFLAPPEISVLHITAKQ